MHFTIHDQNENRLGVSEWVHNVIKISHDQLTGLPQKLVRRYKKATHVSSVIAGFYVV